MKLSHLLITATLMLSLSAVGTAENLLRMPTAATSTAAPELRDIDPQLLSMGLNQFVDLTPAKYKEMTGKKLGLKNTLLLKAAQKKVRQEMRSNDLAGSGADISKGVYVLLAILGLGWLAMGLLSDWSGKDWVVNLVLTILCWLPGLIHALVKMKDYYK